MQSVELNCMNVEEPGTPITVMCPTLLVELERLGAER